MGGFGYQQYVNMPLAYDFLWALHLKPSKTTQAFPTRGSLPKPYTTPDIESQQPQTPHFLDLPLWLVGNGRMVVIVVIFVPHSSIPY